MQKQRDWGEDPMDTAPFRLTRDQAKAASDQILDSLAEACPRLIAIVIDHVDKGKLNERVGFLRSSQIDVAGNTKLVGVPVPIQTLKDQIPDPGVLGSLEEQHASALRVVLN